MATATAEKPATKTRATRKTVTKFDAKAWYRYPTFQGESPTMGYLRQLVASVPRSVDDSAIVNWTGEFAEVQG